MPSTLILNQGIAAGAGTADAQETSLRYWLNTLAGMNQSTILRPDRATASIDRYVGAEVVVAIDSSVDAVDRCAVEIDVSSCAVLLGVFAAVLHRFTQETEIPVGYVIGTNCVALRLGIADETNLRALSARTQRTLDEASTHASVSSDRVLGELRSDSPALERLFRVGFAFEHGGRAAAQMPALLGDCDLALRITQTRDGSLLTRWAFNGLAYGRELIAAVAHHYERLLAAALSHAGEPLLRLPIISEDERSRIMRFANGPSLAYERDCTVPELFRRTAAATPHAIALVSDAGDVTYAELERRSNQLAAVLAARGIGAGSTVGVPFERSLELAPVLLAIAKTGAAYVPLDGEYPRERLEYIVRDAAITCIVSEAALPSRLDFFRGKVVDLSAVAGEVDSALADAPLADVTPESAAYVMYTSGSTGQPKGVVVAHRAIIRLVRGTDYLRAGAGDTFLQHAPLAFDASTFEIWAALLNGARLASPRRGLHSLDELCAAIDRFDVTHMFLTTALFQRLVDTPSARPARLRFLYTGGEIASPAHMLRFLEALPSCCLIAVYGPTENTTFSTWYAIAGPEAVGQSVSIGRPIANSSAFVLDGNQELVPLGAVGELCVGGDGVATGYLNAPELTAARFVPDPFSFGHSARLYRTGDRARLRADGSLEFLGRTDHQLKIRGYRIELSEIEAALQAHESVHDAAVVAAEQDGEKLLFAYVVPRTGKAVTEAVLRSRLTEKLPRYMLPHYIVLTEKLPAHPSGKIDRQALERTCYNEYGERTAAGEPAPGGGRSQGSGALEVAGALRNIWREVLGGSRVPSIDENFFDAGGDSLRLLSVHARVKQDLYDRIAVMDLFERSTIRELAAFIVAARAG